MGHGKVHGQSPEAAVGGQPKGRMLVEDFPVQVDADVGLHVLGAVIQHLHVTKAKKCVVRLVGGM